jgi:hypothetical protein
MLLFFPFIIFPTETGAKNKRPQARPRAKESVMIPTLLMNIPNPHNQTTTQRQYLFANGSGFCEFSFCFSLSYFICSFIAAWDTELVAYIRMGIEVGGKALLGGGFTSKYKQKEKEIR